MINSFNVGEKSDRAQKIAGVISFKDLAEEDRARSAAEVGREFLENLPGKSRKLPRNPGATQGGSSSRNKKRENPEDEFNVKLPNKSATKNPMTKAEFDALKDSGEIDPNRIRPMQNTIKRDFQDGRSLEQMVRELLDGTGKPIEKIRIAAIGEHVFTLDHRRLIAHRLAGKNIQYRKATPEEIAKATGGRKPKMSTKNSGISIEILKRK
ncbi:MAG: hypothetical protein GKS00_01115 [Alphaproteobacteria bacterium]|nr:hypothetical protein [Alphaproteobacteria bacterium]